MLELLVGAALSAVVALLALRSVSSGRSPLTLRTAFHHDVQRRRSHRTALLTAAGLAVIMFITNTACLVVAPGPAVVRSTVALTMLVLVAAVLLQSGALERSAQRPRPAPSAGKTVLAVGAHPDDLELACGGTLAKLVDSGYDVHAIIMSPGSIGGNPALRPSEATEAGRVLGLTTTTVHDLPDTRLSTHDVEMISVIEDKVRDLSPSLILTHSDNDHHQDHHAVHLATLRAARRHSSILCFESPSTTRSFSPSVYVDIDGYLDTKIRAVQTHRDQSGKPYMTPDRLRGIASFRGGQAKCIFAEGFEPVRILAAHPGVPL